MTRWRREVEATLVKGRLTHLTGEAALRFLSALPGRRMAAEQPGTAGYHENVTALSPWRHPAYAISER